MRQVMFHVVDLGRQPARSTAPRSFEQLGHRGHVGPQFQPLPRQPRHARQIGQCEADVASVPIQRIDPAATARQIERTTAHKRNQDAPRVAAALALVTDVAAGSENLLPVMKDAFRAGATLGQIVDALRVVFGEHRPR